MTLAQMEAKQRAILKELWEEKQLLTAKDEKYTVPASPLTPLQSKFGGSDS